MICAAALYDYVEKGFNRSIRRRAEGPYVGARPYPHLKAFFSLRPTANVNGLFGLHVSLFRAMLAQILIGTVVPIADDAVPGVVTGFDVGASGEQQLDAIQR